MSKTINLGRVTAYADAVAAGYTGTREQFAHDLANAANYAAEAGDAAETATAAATTASTAAETATGAAEEASADAEQAHADAQAILGAKETAVAAAATATSKAGEAANSAQQAAASETAAAGSATTASGAATSATASKNAAATSETNAANSANAAAQTLTNVNQAGATQVAAIQAKGTEVLNSIPADYTELSTEVDDLKSDFNNHSNIISTNLMGVDVQENLYLGAADWSGEWTNSDSASLKLSDEKFSGYPVMYSSQSYRRFFKEIPVEAGKTYTYEAWIKPVVAGSVFLYLIWNDHTTNPATITEGNFKQWNNQSADTWVKLSYTFTVSASGNISPYAYSGAGAFYIAKYNLVEGDTVFSLDDVLDEKATKTEISAVGDFVKYNFSLGVSEGTYWNLVVTKNVSAGEKVRLIFDSYSGQYLNYVRVDGRKADQSWVINLCKISNPLHGGTAEFTASEDYVALRFQFYRTTDESSVTASVLLATDKDLGITYDLLHQQPRRVFSVKKDGTGDFTSFVDAVKTACQYMDSVVYVGAGEFDLLDELGASYVSSASATKMGLVFKNRVHVIGSSQTVLKMDYDGSLDNAKEYLSPINTGEHGCTIENIRVEDNNVRYSVHDDQGWFGSTPYINKYINCTFIHKNGKYGDCIGGGLGENCCIEIRGCYLEGDANVERLAYYHANNNTGITNAKGRLTVCDNYFANVGTFKMQKYGYSTEMSTAYVSNNSFGSAPSVTSGSNSPIDNVEIIAWNNEIRA